MALQWINLNDIIYINNVLLFLDTLIPSIFQIYICPQLISVNNNNNNNNLRKNIDIKDDLNIGNFVLDAVELS